MGCAEGIPFDQVRARKRWVTIRQQLHERFDRWLDAREARLSEPEPTLPEVTQVVWELRQRLTRSVTEALVLHRHQPACEQTAACCPQCTRVVKTRGVVSRTLETLVGPVEMRRPSFYCVPCHCGFYPFDDRLELAPGRTQYDVQQATAKL